VRQIRLYFEGDAKLRAANIQAIATDGTPIQDYELPERRTQLADYSRERIFWMTALMETWYLADKEALKRFCKRGFTNPLC
jgi:hypothetical protein